MSPATPDRPNASVAGLSSAATTPVGVRASVQTMNTRATPARMSPRVSPTSVVPRSSNTTVPSALNVSVAVKQVTSPGRLESTAVTSVQSMVAPRGSNNRRVGRRRASTASAIGVRSPCEKEGENDAEDGPLDPRMDAAAPSPGASAAPAATPARPTEGPLSANTAPVNRRSTGIGFVADGVPMSGDDPAVIAISGELARFPNDGASPATLPITYGDTLWLWGSGFVAFGCEASWGPSAGSAASEFAAVTARAVGAGRCAVNACA